MAVFQIKHGAGAQALGDATNNIQQITSELEAREEQVGMQQQRLDQSKQQAEAYAFDRSEQRRQSDERLSFSRYESEQREGYRQQQQDVAMNAERAPIVDFLGGPNSEQAQAFMSMDPADPAYQQVVIDVQEKARQKQQRLETQGSTSRLRQMMEDDPGNAPMYEEVASRQQGVPAEDFNDEVASLFKDFRETEGLRRGHAFNMESWNKGFDSAGLTPEEKLEVRSLMDDYELRYTSDPHDPELSGTDDGLGGVEGLKQAISGFIDPAEIRAGRKRYKDRMDLAERSAADMSEQLLQAPGVRAGLVGPAEQGEAESLSPSKPVSIRDLSATPAARNNAADWMGEWMQLYKGKHPDATGPDLEKDALVMAEKHLGVKFATFAEFEQFYASWQSPGPQNVDVGRPALPWGGYGQPVEAYLDGGGAKEQPRAVLDSLYHPDDLGQFN